MMRAQVANFVGVAESARGSRSPGRVVPIGSRYAVAPNKDALDAFLEAALAVAPAVWSWVSRAVIAALFVVGVAIATGAFFSVSNAPL